MKRYTSILILVISILVIFFLPFGIHIDLGPGPNSLISMIWEIPFEPAWYSIRYFSAFQYYIFYCFFRFFFLLEVILLLTNKYNRTRFILIGVISELIPLMVSIPALFILNSQGENLLPIIFPIPFLLVFDILLVIFKSINIKKLKTQRE
jgi:hypothetical protein